MKRKSSVPELLDRVLGACKHMAMKHSVWTVGQLETFVPEEHDIICRAVEELKVRGQVIVQVLRLDGAPQVFISLPGVKIKNNTKMYAQPPIPEELPKVPRRVKPIEQAIKARVTSSTMIRPTMAPANPLVKDTAVTEKKSKTRSPKMSEFLPDIIKRKMISDWKAPKSIDSFKSSYNKALSIVGDKQAHLLNFPRVFQKIYDTAMEEGYSYSAASGYVSAFREGLREARLKGLINKVADWKLPHVPKTTVSRTAVVTAIEKIKEDRLPLIRLTWWDKVQLWWYRLWS